MDCKIINKLLLVLIFIFSIPVQALEFRGKFIQGHYIIGKTEPGAKILIDKKKVKVSKDGNFAFEMEKDRKLKFVLMKNIKKFVKKFKKKK